MASKKPKEKTLRELSREMPAPEELESFITKLETMDGRAATLVLTSFLDALLERAIAFNLNPDDGIIDALFHSNNAPLQSFSSKIMLAKALGVIGENMRQCLDRMRLIRNVFAHSVALLDFGHPAVEKECRLLNPQKLTSMKYQPDDGSSRENFRVCGIFIAKHLLEFMHHRVDRIRRGDYALPLPFRGIYG